MTTIKKTAVVSLVPLMVAVSVGAQAKAPRFEKAVQLKAGGVVMATEEPGYASPAVFDVNGDGRDDVIVGQFNGGKMKVYSRNEDGSYAKGTWLEADGKIAEVPGVW